MAKHWRDQYLDKQGARSAEEAKRIERSELWEQGEHPGEKGVRGRPGVQLGQRSSSSLKPRFRPTGGGMAGINLSTPRGARYVEPEEAAEPASAGSLPDWAKPPAEPAPAPRSESEAKPAESEPQPQGFLSKLGRLFGRKGD